MYRALLVALAIAATAMVAAYTFGPDAKTVPGKAKATTTVKATTADAKQCVPDATKRQLRGVWIATVRNLDWPSKPGLTQAQQKAEYTKILDSAVQRRLNAVFVQVRPASDAIYRSPYEPWSQSLTGTAGKDPGWDPLPYLIDEAHKRGLEFHAWFNPYRAALDGNTAKLPAAHPARRHPEWVVKYGDGLYYNPGLPEVRDHVVQVVDDVVRRYNVDGIHFDDYFYPYPVQGATFNDSAAFRKYGGGEKLADWRRGNVDKLIAEVSKNIHSAKRWVKFGVSPFGIWRNQAEDPKGSATSGMSAYDSIYADPLAWIKSGDVDYIVPQLYWPRGFAAADYNVLVPWWAKQVKGTDVQLYIGQALYRVGTKDTPAWTKPGELPAHLAVNRKYDEVQGDVYFSAKQLISDPLGVMDRLAAGPYKRPA
ncbi:MAG TPA: family 10 glycosylhydrolase, partial [Thermopolyspora sp.]